jgi:aldehyde:ferredoxin oxidoreductase
MAKRIGNGSEKYLIQTRGLESGRDPRVRWDTWSFGYLINARGGDHLRVQSPAENLRESAPAEEYFYEISPPEKVVTKMDIFDDWKQKIFDLEKNTVNIPYMAAWSQDMINIVNSVGTCIRPPVLWSLGPTIYSELLTTLTGIEFSPEDVRKAGERITNIQRIFNFKAGEKREGIKYGPKFYNMPIKGRKLDKAKVDKVLDEYFEVRNWDTKTALPREEKLKELSLDKLAWSGFS